MITETTYSDSLVAITGESILFKRYNIFERDRIVLFSDIEKIIVKPASICNGKFRFHGTGEDDDAARIAIDAMNGPQRLPRLAQQIW